MAPVPGRFVSQRTVEARLRRHHATASRRRRVRPLAWSTRDPTATTRAIVARVELRRRTAAEAEGDGGRTPAPRPARRRSSPKSSTILVGSPGRPRTDTPEWAADFKSTASAIPPRGRTVLPAAIQHVASFIPPARARRSTKAVPGAVSRNPGAPRHDRTAPEASSATSRSRAGATWPPAPRRISPPTTKRATP